MSKKRKTRKQKEQAKMRQKLSEETIERKYHTVVNEPKQENKTSSKTEKTLHNTNYSNSDLNHLKKDLISIGAASGIVVVFNTLLFTLLSTGVVRLNFLGY